jgi:hypothetical protein
MKNEDYPVSIELELETGEKFLVETPFDYEVLIDAEDYPQEDCEISLWVSELNLEDYGVEDKDALVASWTVPPTV